MLSKNPHDPSLVVSFKGIPKRFIPQPWVIPTSKKSFQVNMLLGGVLLGGRLLSKCLWEGVFIFANVTLILQWTRSRAAMTDENLHPVHSRNKRSALPRQTFTLAVLRRFPQHTKCDSPCEQHWGAGKPRVNEICACYLVQSTMQLPMEHILFVDSSELPHTVSTNLQNLAIAQPHQKSA